MGRPIAKLTDKEFAMIKRKEKSLSRGWTHVHVPVELVDDYRISCDALLVGIALCRFMDVKTSIAHPSWETLEAVTRRHRRHVSRGIKELEKCGFLTRRRGGGRVSTTYILHVSPRRRQRDE